MMVAILQLKASKQNVYLVSFTAVIFTILIPSDLYYPRFLSTKFSAPNLYEVQPDLDYPRLLRSKLIYSSPKYRG